MGDYRRALLARKINKNAAHLSGGDGEEMSPAVHIDFIFSEQSQISLMHQGCRLNRPPGAVSVEITLSQSQQILIDHSEKFFARLTVTTAPLFEDRGECD